MIRTILSFDISSTCIGYAVLTWNDKTNKIKFIKCNNYKPTKEGNILERLMKTKIVIQEIIKTVSPDYIAIEDIIQFMAGKSTAKTIITLTSFNRMLGLLAYEYLGRTPELYNVMSIRHGLKLTKELPKKEDMLQLVEYHLNTTLPKIYKKNKIDYRDETYDQADAVAVGLYHCFKLAGKLKKK